MKNKSFIVLVIILIAISCGIIRNYSLKEINKEGINVKEYIEVTDRVSENKIQINWKEVVAVTGVLKKNNFENIIIKEIEVVAKSFIKDEKGKYKLNSLSYVLDNFEFNDKEIKLAQDYLEDMRYFGLIPQRLQPETKYMKFIENIKDEAVENYKEYKILPSITIAQAILESGWGDSDLAKNYNNLFGIKADRFWDGESVTLETVEFEDTKINDKFRKYKDQGLSVDDHGKFLSKNKRYKNNGVFDANTYIYQAKALEKAGYSTAINENGEKIYASMLINLIQQYNLQVLDSEVQS